MAGLMAVCCAGIVVLDWNQRRLQRHDDVQAAQARAAQEATRKRTPAKKKVAPAAEDGTEDDGFVSGWGNANDWADALHLNAHGPVECTDLRTPDRGLSCTYTVASPSGQYIERLYCNPNSCMAAN